MSQLNQTNSPTTNATTAATGEYYYDTMNGTISVGSGAGGFFSGTVPTAAINSVYTGATLNTGWITSDAEAISKLDNRISAIEDQLMILRPDKLLEEKYPALKEAYDAYQIILKMVKNDKKA
jgi:hypothetical protein